MLTAAVRSVAAAIVLLAGAPHGAHHTIPQVREAVVRLSAQEDTAVQEYDQAAQTLRSAQRYMREVSREVREDRAQLDAEQVKVAQIAAAAYESGTLGSAGAVLNTGNLDQILSQASLLGQLSDTQAAEVRQYKAQLRATQAVQDRAIRGEEGTRLLAAQLRVNRDTINRELAKQQALLGSLTGAQQTAALSGLPGSSTSATAPYTGPTNTQAGKAVAYAYSKLGDPYVWGATGPDTFDCSGLVMAAWAAAGVSIPRTTFAQVAALPAVSVNELEPGDLLFFLGDDHVGMYVGNGMLIDAPQTGEDVELVPFAGWFRDNFDSAARP